MLWWFLRCIVLSYVYKFISKAYKTIFYKWFPFTSHILIFSMCVCECVYNFQFRKFISFYLSDLYVVCFFFFQKNIFITKSVSFPVLLLFQYMVALLWQCFCCLCFHGTITMVNNGEDIFLFSINIFLSTFYVSFPMEKIQLEITAFCCCYEKRERKMWFFFQLKMFLVALFPL